jgi:S1 RNA binding domain protein
MGVEVGSILTGKITGITKFGAFVDLEDGKRGLVHISEVANSYVNDIREHITEGQEVTVKVLSVGEANKISLSIKKAVSDNNNERFVRNTAYSAPAKSPPVQRTENFEDRLTKFMQESKKNLEGSKLYGEKRQRRESKP